MPEIEFTWPESNTFFTSYFFIMAGWQAQGVPDDQVLFCSVILWVRRSSNLILISNVERGKYKEELKKNVKRLRFSKGMLYYWEREIQSRTGQGWLFNFQPAEKESKSPARKARKKYEQCNKLPIGANSRWSSEGWKLWGMTEGPVHTSLPEHKQC